MPINPILIAKGSRDLVCYETTDSTKEAAARLASTNGWKETIFVADYQTAGKGAHGRSWFAPPEACLLVSLLIRPRSGIAVEKLSGIIAYAVADAVRKLTGLETTVKPPNDVMIRDKKISGVLAEISTSPEGGPRWILSFGLNVGSIDFPPDLTDKAGTLTQFHSHVPSRERILNCILENLENMIGKDEQ